MRYRRGPVRGPVTFWPVSRPFLAALVAVLVFLLLVLQIGVLEYAYRRIGIDRNWLLALLAASVLGGAVNVPVGTLSSRLPMVTARRVSYYGVQYVVPAVRTARTIVSVNVGGALVPVGIAVYLLLHDHLGREALLAVAAVTAVVYLVARPVRGVGIVVPALLPPLVAAVVALLLLPAAAPALAYVAGVLGSLIGADLLNLPRVRDLGAPVVSIGGAGTFDGIFLSGVVAVLVASL